MKDNRIVIGIILLAIIIYFLNKEINSNSKICFADQFTAGKASINFNGSTVYLIDKNGKVLDKTNISVDKTVENSAINLFNLDKELPLDGVWKIVLPDKGQDVQTIIISDFEVGIAEMNTMFSTTPVCKLFSWKVDGIEYSVTNGDEFVLAKTN